MVKVVWQKLLRPANYYVSDWTGCLHVVFGKRATEVVMKKLKQNKNRRLFVKVFIVEG